MRLRNPVPGTGPQRFRCQRLCWSMSIEVPVGGRERMVQTVCVELKHHSCSLYLQLPILSVAADKDKERIGPSVASSLS